MKVLIDRRAINIQGQIREIPLSDKKPKKVIVSSVTSPSEFYLKVQGTEDIENQMQEFYSGSSNNASEIVSLKWFVHSL